MKPLRSIVSASLALAVSSSVALRAETFPIFEDTAGSPISATIPKANGAAKTLSVSNRSSVYINFAVGSSGINPAMVTGARLVLYIPKSSATGVLSIKNLTSGFTETFTTKTIPAPTVAAGTALDTIDLAQTPLKGDFFISDITAQVKAWLTTPASEFGVAITSDGTATATLAAKEGAGSGHPAYIEVDVNGGGGSVSGTTATFSGGVTATTFTGSGASLTALPSANLTGALPAVSGAALTGLNATNITSGTLADARLSANIPLLNASTTAFTGQLVGSSISNADSSFRFPSAVNVGTGGIYLPGAFAPAQSAFVGNSGNFISFAHSGVSEDSLSYKGNTFYFRNTGGGGGDQTDPDLNIGGGTYVGANTNFTTMTAGTANVTTGNFTSLNTSSAYISGSIGSPMNTGRFFGSTSNALADLNGATHSNYSLIAVSRIAALSFDAVSDARIKIIEGRSNAANDLSTLQKIEITDYKFKDTITRGNTPQKKVIAQQVERVYPQAVGRLTDVVPDIFAKAPEHDGWITLATDLKVGDRVRIIGEKEEAIQAVLEVREGAFRTAFQPAGDEVFVYGREVPDFHTVDYEAISMLNVSATQELARQLAAKEEQIAALTQKLTALEASLAARLTALEAAAVPARATTASVKLQ